MVGMVLAELLQGIRGAREGKRVRAALRQLPFLDTSREHWERAGELSSALRRKGRTIPLSDLLIASVALSHDLEIFTTDPHFRAVPGLKLRGGG